MVYSVLSSQVKRLLCISPHGAQAVTDNCGAFQHWGVCIVRTLAEAAAALEEQRFLVGILLDCVGHYGDGELGAFLRLHSATQWIGVVDQQILQSPGCRALMAIHLCDFHTKRVDHARLLHTVGHMHGLALLREAPASHGKTKAYSMTGDSAAIARLRHQIGRVAAVRAPVLICGETGSGKELVAQAVHKESAFAQGPFVAINCAAIPANLIQSELFGHEKGAFTGAGRERKGLIESARDGTIFLDEIAEMPMELQANLLRFLQERTIYRVGGTKSMVVEARVIAATHVDLQAAVSQGRFREDLYYRLNVLPLAVPPLRERMADLPILVAEFFKAYSGEKNARLKGVSSTAMDAILAHAWPGNVRELMNRMHRAMVLAEGSLISAEDLGLGGKPGPAPGPGLNASRSGAERHAIVACLAKGKGNVSQAARELKVSRMTLYRLMEKHRITTSSLLFGDLQGDAPDHD